MSKKNIGLILLLVVLGAIYVFNFTGLFHESSIEVTTRIRPQNTRRNKTSKTVTGNTVSFVLNNKYGLTSLKVVEDGDLKTNKYPHAFWHLISDSNSIPTKSIMYGVSVDGMKPEFEKVKPEPLQPNVNYVLLLEAGKLKGQTTFRFR